MVMDENRSMKKISVILCDDHTVFRDGLRALLGAADDIEVIGEAENGHEAVTRTRELLPDVVLMDLAMPLLNGLEATRQIRRENRATRVLMLSGYNDDHSLDLALQAGVAGYVMKETTEAALFEGIRQVHRGDAFFSAPISQRLLKHWENKFLNGRPRKVMINTLTSRQTETLQLVAEGYTTKEIAVLLSISVKTVEKHRQRIMNQLNIHEVASLTRYAISNCVLKTGRWATDTAAGAVGNPGGHDCVKPKIKRGAVRDPVRALAGNPMEVQL
jgi:DNA-binding NarL/FixJ family response regulator